MLARRDENWPANLDHLLSLRLITDLDNTVSNGYSRVHIVKPGKAEVFTTSEEAKTRVLNWGFSQGHALVCSSANNMCGQWEFECVQHGDETRNTRKTLDKDRQRAVTHVHANSCKFALYTK